MDQASLNEQTKAASQGFRPQAMVSVRIESSLGSCFEGLPREIRVNRVAETVYTVCGFLALSSRLQGR